MTSPWKIEFESNGKWEELAVLSDIHITNDEYKPDFTIGDVVAMRGQDQLMTVEGYCSECDSVDVVWFAGNDVDGWTLHRDTFDGAMLVNLEDDDDGDD